MIIRSDLLVKRGDKPDHILPNITIFIANGIVL